MSAFGKGVVEKVRVLTLNGFVLGRMPLDEAFFGKLGYGGGEDWVVWHFGYSGIL